MTDSGEDATRPPDRAAPLDRAFDALCDSRRRRILRLVRDHDAPAQGHVTVDDVVPDGPARDRIATRLHHVHLPKLADAGYVEWDRDSDTVRPGPRFDDVAPILRFLDANPGAVPGEP
jgi:hypothetical protein